MKVVMEGGKFKTETEVFRAFRLANFGAQRLSDDEAWAVLQHIVDKMVAGDPSAVVIGQFRHQADLLETMLNRERNPQPPKPKKHPWRKYHGGKQRNNAPMHMATEAFSAVRLGRARS